MSSDNIVYIGRKPVMNYYMTVMTSFESSDGRVALKARGNNISKAVDMAEITRNRFMDDLSVDSIEIGTDELESDEGGTKNVSRISILLKRE